MFLVVPESVVLAPSVPAGTEKKSELSMLQWAHGRLQTYPVRVEYWSSMGKNRQASNIAIVEEFPDWLDC